jgi:hypothetical protein
MCGIGTQVCGHTAKQCDVTAIGGAADAIGFHDGSTRFRGFSHGAQLLRFGLSLRYDQYYA